MFLAACVSAAEEARPTPTPEASPTATQTVDWFPATATSTPRLPATVTPTADMRPGLGAILLDENFSDGEFWSTTQSNEATVVVEGGRINLSLDEERSYLTSTREEPVVADFYAEIRASTNLCRGEDEYGLVFRALNPANYYRFALSCDGRAKVDRLYQNGFSNMVAWTQTSQVPNLAPASVRLGVWARGSELRFFVNDQYLFSLTDSLLFQGNLGVFVHASGASDVSVSFSDLTVWSVDE